MEPHKTIYGFDIVTPTQPITYKPKNALIINTSSSSLLSSSLSCSPSSSGNSLEKSPESSPESNSGKTTSILENLMENYFIKYTKYSHPIAIKKK